MKSGKKTIAAVAAALILFSLAACGGGTSSGGDSVGSAGAQGSESVKDNVLLGDEEKLVYSTDKEFLMYPYGGVPGKLRVYDKNGGIVEDNVSISDEQLEEYYKQIKDAGMNMTAGGYINMTYADYIRGLKVCEKIGLKMMVYDQNLVALLMNDKLSDAVVVDQVLSNYSEMLDSPAFAGISVWDEPSVAKLGEFKTALERWNIIAEGKIFYINLFPSIAFSSSTYGTFEDYIKTFVEKVDVDYVCYDHYPLQTSGKNNYLRDDFLYNLATVKANSDGRRTFTVLQSVQYGGMHRALSGAADVTFQVYSALCYGFEGFGWFTFWPPVPNDGATTFGDAAYDRQTNQPTDTYYFIKDGLNEIRKLEDVYFNFTWKGTKTVIGAENANGGENYDFALAAFTETATPRIESVSAEQDTVIGVFEDKDGNDGFLVVNYTEPSANLENKVVMKLKDCTKAAVWENGVQKVYKVENGWLTLHQKSGDGFFVVPIK